MGGEAEEAGEDGAALGGLAVGEKEPGAGGERVEANGLFEVGDGGGGIAEGFFDEGEFFAEGGVVRAKGDGGAEELAGIGFLVFEEENHAEGGEDFGIAVEAGDEGGEAAVAVLDEFGGAVAFADFNGGETEGALAVEGGAGIAPDAELGGGGGGGGGAGLDAMVGEGAVAAVGGGAAGHVAGGAGLGGDGVGRGQGRMAGAAGGGDVDGGAVGGVAGAAPELAGGLAGAFAEGELFDVADDAEVLAGAVVDDGEGTDAGFAGEVAALADGVAGGRGEARGIGDVGAGGAGEVGGGISVALIAGNGLGIGGIAA